MRGHLIRPTPEAEAQMRLVVFLREQEKLPFKDIAARLGGVGPGRAGQLYKQAKSDCGLIPIPDAIPDDRPLAEVPLSLRTGNCLYNQGFRTVGEVRQALDANLLEIPNFGRVSLKEVRETLG